MNLSELISCCSPLISGEEEVNQFAKIFLTYFQPMLPFYTPLKTSENQRGLYYYRSSPGSCSIKKLVFKTSAKFTGKHLCRSLISITLQAVGLPLFEKEAPTQVFSLEFCRSFKDTFYRTTPGDCFCHYQLLILNRTFSYCCSHFPFTCSKLTIKTLEQDMKYVQS